MHRLGTISNINYVTTLIDGIADVTGPDSVMVRASASGTGGRGFDPGPHYTKDAKMVPVATLLGAQHSHMANTTLLGVRPRCADKSTAEHYIHTNMAQSNAQ